MKSSSFILLTLLVSAALMVFLQQQSIEQRISDRSKDLGKAYVNRQKLIPTAGFDAAVADFMWLRTNCSSEPRMKEGLSDEEKIQFRKRQAELHLSGYNKVVSLDPTFKKAYNFAISRVMSDLPERAIALSEMAMVYAPESKKEFAETAGYIANNIRKDNKQALSYYKMCVEGGPSKDYLGRCYLRAVLRDNNIDPNDSKLEVFAQRIVKYNEIRLELQAQNKSVDMMGEGDAKGAPFQSGAYQDNWIGPIVLKNVRDFMSRAHLENPAPELIAKVTEIFNSLKPEGHSCSRCFSLYEAGDKFCSNCGFQVPVFGVCSKDGTILRAKFCHTCGTAAVSVSAKP